MRTVSGPVADGEGTAGPDLSDPRFIAAGGIIGALLLYRVSNAIRAPIGGPFSRESFGSIAAVAVHRRLTQWMRTTQWTLTQCTADPVDG